MHNEEKKQQISQVLAKYIPSKAVPLAADWILHYNIRLSITDKRAHVLGDYRPPVGSKIHTITINYNLNPYQFLITFVHEVAHLVTFNNYNLKGIPAESHGREWKSYFQKLMEHVFPLQVFPDDIEGLLRKHMTNPKYTSCADHDLMRGLRNYEKLQHLQLVVEELPEGAIFELEDGRIFVKGKLLRKNYSCHELGTNRKYYVSPLAEVVRKLNS